MEVFELTLNELNEFAIDFHKLIEDTDLASKHEEKIFIRPDSNKMNLARINLLYNINYSKIDEIELNNHIINLVNLCFYDNINEETGLTDNSFYFFYYIIKYFYKCDYKNEIKAECTNNFSHLDKQEFVITIYRYIYDKIELLSVNENKNYLYKKRLTEILQEVNSYMIRFKIKDIKTINKYRDQILNNLGNINNLKKIYFELSCRQYSDQNDSQKILNIIKGQPNKLRSI